MYAQSFENALAAAGDDPQDASELVWDREGVATVSSGGYYLPAGVDSVWSPPLLLATAAGASLLITFLELARTANLPLLGYVAQQTPQLDFEHRDVARITIAVCISVPSDEAAAQARALWTQASQAAPVIRTLKCAVVCEAHVVVLSDLAAGN